MFCIFVSFSINVLSDSANLASFFVGSGIFKSGNPEARAAACVKAVTYYTDAKVVADVSRGLGDAMVGINVADIPVPHRLAERGW